MVRCDDEKNEDEVSEIFFFGVHRALVCYKRTEEEKREEMCRWMKLQFA